MKDLDRMMGGGLLPGTAHLLEVEPGTGEMAFIASFLDDGIRQREMCGIVGYDRPHEDIIAKLEEFGFDAEKPLRSGSMHIADLCIEGKYDPDHASPILMTENLYDPNSMLRLYYDMAQLTEKNLKSGKYTGARVVVYSLSSQIMNYKFEPAYKVVKKAIQIAEQQNATSLTLITPKMFDETVVATFEHMFDGIVILTMKEVKGRFQRFVRVKESPIAGFYSDEVPYEIVGNKPRLLTSFAEPLQTFRDHIKFNADGTITMAGSRFFLANIILPNVILQRAANVIGYDAAAEEVYNLFKATGQAELKSLLPSMNVDMGKTDARQLLQLYTGYLSAAAWGKTELVGFSDRFITFRVIHSLCTLSGASDKPMAPYLAGSLAGATELILGKPIKCIETECTAKGDDYCEFICKVRD